MVNSLAERTKLAIFWDSANNKFVFDSTKIGYVYLIKAEGTNRLKIGYSKDPEKRLLAIQSPQSPFKLKLVYKELVADCASFEKFLHDYYKDYRVFGEWFDIPLEEGDVNECGYRFVVTPDNKRHWVKGASESIIIRSTRSSFIAEYFYPSWDNFIKYFCDYAYFSNIDLIKRHCGLTKYLDDLFFLQEQESIKGKQLDYQEIIKAYNNFCEIFNLMIFFLFEDEDYHMESLGCDTERFAYIITRLSWSDGYLKNHIDTYADS